MVLSRFREPINRFFGAMAVVLEATGLSPNAVSFIAIAVTGAGGVLIATGQLLVGAVAAGLGGVLDLLDGALARRTGTTTAYGGFLDSVLDRIADGILFLSVGWYYATSWIWAASFAAFIGAVTTSYARARVYEEVHPPRDAWTDLVERGERLIILLVAIGAQGLGDRLGGDVQFLPWVVVALAVLGFVTIVQRSLRARTFIEEGV